MPPKSTSKTQSASSASRRIVMRQKWRDLLFIHWPIDPDTVARTLPAGLTVDTFEGRTYLGIVAFRMHDIAFPPLPPLPGFSALNEINLRAYVKDKSGHPGIYFYSLEATSRLAVWTARTFFHLPYFFSNIQHGDNTDASHQYTLRRRSHSNQDRFVYSTDASAAPAAAGSLDEFLVERYSFFTPHRRHGQLIRGDVAHEPYALAATTLHDWSAQLFRLNGFDAPASEPAHVTFSPGVEVDIYPLESV